MCDKKNSVLFTDTGCFVLSPDFKLADESQVLLNVPSKNNMYSIDMKNIVPKESLTYLVAKATFDESMLWHRRLEFKNRVMSEFYEKKGIKMEFSVARTPQQNSVVERRNRTLIEAARTMFLEDKPIIACDGPKWLFDIDVLTKSMNYVPVVVGTNSNDVVGTKESIGAGHSSKEPVSSQDYILMSLWKDGSLFNSSSKDASNDEPQPSNDAKKKDDEGGIDD
ncbi:ribonuclease H-like domain-containing protein [Tanacetum coccineum]